MCVVRRDAASAAHDPGEAWTLGRKLLGLERNAEARHTVYRIVDGDDPDWASWYADWLTRLSELPQILETTPVRSELTWLVVSLDEEYAAAKPETPWPQWYAERIIKHFTGG
jgi:hypothetical protein